MSTSGATTTYVLEKRGNGWIAVTGSGGRNLDVIIALGDTRESCEAVAKASFSVPTIKDPKFDQCFLNHTYRIIRKLGFPSVPDITAPSLAAAIEALLIIPESILQVKVWKSSGKIGTAGDVSAGWSKCTEAIPEAKPKDTSTLTAGPPAAAECQSDTPPAALPRVRLMQAGVMIPLGKLRVNPFQPEGRRQFTAEEKAKWGVSLQTSGQISTALVRERDGFFEVADGQQRWMGLAYLVEIGFPEFGFLRADIAELTDQQMADIVFESAEVRKNLTDIDKAHFFKDYLEKFGGTQAELAERYNISQGEVSNTIRLLDLPAEIQEKVISQEISPTHARGLLQLNAKPKEQQKLLKQIIDDKIPVAELDRVLKRKLWDATLPLVCHQYASESPAFDVAACSGCQKAEKMANPYGAEKEMRCADPDCWRGKQKEALKEQRQTQIAKATEMGAKKVYFHGDEGYGKCVAIYNKPNKRCAACEHLVATEHSGYNSDFSLSLACEDPQCFRDREKESRDKESRRRELEEQKKLEAVNPYFTGARMTDKALLSVTVCLLRRFSREFGGNPHLKQLADIYGLHQKGDEQQKVTIASIMAILDSPKTDRATLESFLCRLAYESFTLDCWDETQRQAMLSNFAHAAKETPRERLQDELPPVPIPAGVRRDQEVPSEECAGCELGPTDHTIGHKFREGNASLKVCIKDYARLEKSQRLATTETPTDVKSDVQSEESTKAALFDTVKIITPSGRSKQYHVYIGEHPVSHGEGETLLEATLSSLKGTCQFDIVSVDQRQQLATRIKEMTGKEKDIIIGILEAGAPVGLAP